MSDSMISSDMGDLLGEYKEGKKNKISTVLLGVMVLLIGIPITLYFIARYINSPDTLTLQVIFIIGIITLALGIFLIVLAKFLRQIYVAVYDEGLYYKKGKTERVISWDNIIKLYEKVIRHYSYGVYLRTSYAYTITEKNYNYLVFDGKLPNIDKLGEILKEKIYNILLPKYTKEFNEGKTLKFGDITISKKEIGNSKKTIPWNNLDYFKLGNGIITIKGKDKENFWTVIDIASTSNVYILITLVDSIFRISK